MKKIILLLSVAISSYASYAQVSFGAQIGANLGLSHTSTDYVDPVYGAATFANDPKVGFIIGVLADASFGKLSFRPEVNFIQKGSKTGGYDYGVGLSSPYSTKRTLNYVEVPLNVVYNLHLGVGKAFFGLGPAVGFGLSGKDKGPQYDNNGDYIGTGKTDIKFDGKKSDDITSSTDVDAHLKRTDISLNILAGFQLKMGFFVKIGYEYGFVNIDPNKDNAAVEDRSTYKNRGFNVCVGFMFGGSK